MLQRQMCNVTVAGSSNVTVNNGSSTTPREAPASGRMVSLPGKRQVLVTPLSSVSIPPASRATHVQAHHGSPFRTGLRAQAEVHTATHCVDVYNQYIHAHTIVIAFI